MNSKPIGEPHSAAETAMCGPLEELVQFDAPTGFSYPMTASPSSIRYSFYGSISRTLSAFGEFNDKQIRQG
jgi:hypothetical protein